MKLMAKQIADRDTKVRGAALNAISEAYFQAGEKQTYKMIGNIPDKDMSMLEERIKRAAKSRPPPGGPVAAMPPPVQEPPEPAAPTVATGLPRPGTNRNMTSGLRRYGHPAAPQIPAPTAPMATQNYGSSEFKLPQSKGSPGGRDRPVSGAFTLDLDKIESGSMYGSIGGPQLVNHNLDDIFDEEPVKLPSRLAGPRRPDGPMSLSPKAEPAQRRGSTTVTIKTGWSTKTRWTYVIVTKSRTGSTKGFNNCYHQDWLVHEDQMDLCHCHQKPNRLNEGVQQLLPLEAQLPLYLVKTQRPMRL